jgi:hypothetical protein
MMSYLKRSLLAVLCGMASFNVMAADGPSDGDMAIVSCSTVLAVSAVSASFDFTPSTDDCATTLVELEALSVWLEDINTTSNNIVYTLAYFPQKTK